LLNSYPNRPDIVEQAQKLAAALGGRLHPPRLSWKYAWTQWIFGWTAAKWVQARYNQRKSSFLRSWDKGLSQLEKRELPNLGETEELQRIHNITMDRRVP
jgi:hypothetical protein